jgi:hypothetical protein
LSSKWLVEFKGKNSSGKFNQNFLWNNESVYIMDNHRAALWCWFQHLSKDSKYNLFHIDRHFDTVYTHIEQESKHLPNMYDISISDYLEFNYDADFGNTLLFSYENYLSIFLENYGNIIKECFFATHEDGDKPKFNKCQIMKLWDIPDNMDYCLNNHETNWIINVDIDYFFSQKDDSQLLMFSDDYIESMFRPIAERIKDGKIDVFTLCLSPEWSSGWDESLIICDKICKILELDFRIPHNS